MAALNSGESVKGAFIGVSFLIFRFQLIDSKYLIFESMNYILSSFYILLFSSSLLAETYTSLGYESEPKLIEQTTTKLTLSWETNLESDGYYRLSTYPVQISSGDALSKFTEEEQSSFLLGINDLDNDKFYYIQTVNILGTDTLYGDIGIYSLVSESSGAMEVYFNNSIDASKSRGSSPNGSTASDLESAVLAKINAATKSVDYCVYNTSRESIVNALIDAEDRGVKVRVIYNEKSESSNVGFNRALPFNTVERLGDGLMHNKFIVIDADDADNSWVMSGSTNFTEFQLDTDPNHVIFIQDKNLANAYVIEFEEMWGSDADVPNENNGKFGINKSDNTPHEFSIGGKKVELYFSPSDFVSVKINTALTSATSTIDAALLIFTKWETRDALELEIGTGTRFRGIVEDTESSEDVIPILNRLGADIKDHPQEAQMHHKYAIIDEALQNENSKVITGSHNWTHSADIRHDENLLIIHDPEIANWFQQEWDARWAEQTTAVVDFNKAEEVLLYPNPAEENIMLANNNQIDNYKILDIRGALVRSIQTNPAEEEQLLDISGLESGFYVIVGRSGNEKLTLGSFIKN